MTAIAYSVYITFVAGHKKINIGTSVIGLVLELIKLLE